MTRNIASLVLQHKNGIIFDILVLRLLSNSVYND